MNNSNKVYLSLGSNIGDRESNLAQAITAIEISEGVDNVKSASFYLTEPLYNKEQEFFINTVIGLDTILKPFDFLDLVKNIESMLGRKKQKKKNMPRIIDIDILVHGESIIDVRTIDKKRKFELEFEVLNALIAPDTNPIFRLVVKPKQ